MTRKRAEHSVKCTDIKYSGTQDSMSWVAFWKDKSDPWCTHPVSKSVIKKIKYTLFVTYTGWMVKFVICIWPILFSGSVDSCCAAPRDWIKIIIGAFGCGSWLDINLVHVFDDCGGNQGTWKKPQRHGEHMQTPQASPTWELDQDHLAVSHSPYNYRGLLKWNHTS